MVSQIDLYIDTNVLIDWIDSERKNERSQYVLRTIRKSSDLVATVSPFTLMEAIEERQEVAYLRQLIRSGFTLREIRERGRSRELSRRQTIECFNQVQRFLFGLGNKVILRAIDSPEFWTESSHLVQSTRLSAPDAIHVNAAISTGCEVIVTGDRQLKDALAGTDHLSRRIRLVFVGSDSSKSSFIAETNAVLADLRTRYSSQPKRRPPEDIRRLITVLAPVLGRTTADPKFVSSFEERLAGERLRVQPPPVAPKSRRRDHRRAR